MHTDVILYSGGMDSYILGTMFPQAARVYFNLGTRYAAKELSCLPQGVIVDHSLDLRELERPDSVVEFRNLLLAALAAARYGTRVMLGATAGDLNVDNQPAFAEAASRLLTLLADPPRTVELALPIKHLTKCELVAYYIAAGNSAEALCKTVSCYHQTLMYCGRCKSCIRKWLAQEANGIDSTPWDTHPSALPWLSADMQRTRHLWAASPGEWNLVRPVFDRYGIHFA